MGESVHIIASCTDRKRSSAGAPVRLRDVPARSDRADHWWAELTESSGPTTAARELYVGSYWSVIRDLPKAAGASLDISLWVASAGYGLVSAETPLKSYSATFAAGQPDSITRLSGESARRVHRTWWTSIGKQPIPGSRAKRSVSALTRTSPDSVVVVVGSPTYISAMQDDLLAARQKMAEPDRLVLVTSTTKPLAPELAEHVVPSDSRLLSAFGQGSRVSLHALTAQKILAEAARWPLRATTLRRRYSQLLRRLPAYEQPKGRVPRSDKEVRSLILRALREDPDIRRTPLLQQLRQAGHQCEQKRFRRLFEEVAQSHAS